MKLPILLGAQLLSALPAIADDYLHLEYDTNLSIINKDLKVNQLIGSEEDVDIFHNRINSPVNQHLDVSMSCSSNISVSQ